MIVIKGAGDIASGIAVRLYRSGYKIAMTDLPEPTSIRTTVSFSEAIRLGSNTVEQIGAVRCETRNVLASAFDKGVIPVIPINSVILADVLSSAGAIVDARLAKINIDTQIDEAKTVIGIGPGFTAGLDCHAVIETQRGHYLGRVLYSGTAAENTGIPGIIGGYGEERVLRAPCEGFFCSVRKIGDTVKEGETVATVNGKPVIARIPGLIRGLLPDGIYVSEGMKSGDVDPRSKSDFCQFVSDKALAVGGGVLEALLHFGVFPDQKTCN